MENNLYQKITNLVNRQRELKRIGGIIKYDKSKRADYDAMVKEYELNDEILDFIKINCFITPLKLEAIISEQEKKKYILKIFRETNENILGDTYYTGRFIVCYLCKESKFFNSNERPIVMKSVFGDKSEQYTNNSLRKEQFKNLVESLNKGYGKIVSTHEELTFIPTLAISNYLEVVNFTNLFIYGSLSEFICDDFQIKAKTYIKKYLEQIDADKFLTELDNQETKTF